MTENIRPRVAQPYDTAPIEKFIAELQEAVDTGDAVLFNKRFAADILWGSPFAAVASGYEQIHAIHKKMFASVTPVKGAASYKADHIRFVAEDVAFAYVRRTSQQQKQGSEPLSPGSFDELALFVLVKRNDQWWLAAAQHVPDRRDIYAAAAPR
jgi:uncharacterized protein (TIGR02246 family)